MSFKLLTKMNEQTILNVTQIHSWIVSKQTFHFLFLWVPIHFRCLMSLWQCCSCQVMLEIIQFLLYCTSRGYFTDQIFVFSDNYYFFVIYDSEYEIYYTSIVLIYIYSEMLYVISSHAFARFYIKSVQFPYI